MSEMLPPHPATTRPADHNGFLLVISWLWAGVPLAWGVYETVRTSLALFR